MPNQIADAKRQIKDAQQTVELLISMTPTGERRNSLTEANIHLLAAQEALKGVPDGHKSILFR